MSDLSTRILDAVQGDPTTIQALASAVARNDADAVRGLLGARGVELSAEDVATLLSHAGSGADSAAFTSTVTFTFT